MTTSTYIVFYPFLCYNRKMTEQSPNIALIGGGTGSFTLLRELKELTPNITAIVSMSDDGGSTGFVRDTYGILPPGDIRQCLVALSPPSETRSMFDYRVPDGPLAGQSVGNLWLAEKTLELGSFELAVDAARVRLESVGQVLPVTLEDNVLVMDDGREVIIGETKIGDHKINNRHAAVRLQPPAAINPKVEQALDEADVIAIAPGDIYRSLLPALAVNGMAEAIARSPAIKVAVSNLVSKPNHTHGWHAVDHGLKLEEYLGNGALDVLIYNAVPPSAQLLARYALEGEFPISSTPDRLDEIRAQTVGDDLVADEVFAQNPCDKAIARTLIRHNAKVVGRHIMRVARS